MGLLIARLTGTTSRYAGQMAAGRDVDQAAAIAELREISTDPQALAAAAFYASDDDCPYRGEAVALLIQAGAASGGLARYVDYWRAKRLRPVCRRVSSNSRPEPSPSRHPDRP